VAVKVQYPGIAEALEADLGTAAIIGRMGRAIAPGVDPNLIVAEVRERVLEELDYELEAQNQRLFARAHRGHPFAHVPDVVTSLSRRRVLVADWVDGAPFAAMLELPDDERARLAEIIERFFFGGVHYLGRFNVDAHPGNYMLMDDGRMAFIDFGSVKEVDVPRLRRSVDLLMAAADGDAQRTIELLGELGYVRPGREPDPELFTAQVRGPRSWLLDDCEFTVDRRYVARVMAAQAVVNAEMIRFARNISLPPDDLMLQRMELGVLAVMGQLGATRNWHRIAREGWFGDEARTELGRAEQAFWRERGVTPVLLR